MEGRNKFGGDNGRGHLKMRINNHHHGTKRHWIDELYADAIHDPIVYYYSPLWLSITIIMKLFVFVALSWIGLKFFDDLDGELTFTIVIFIIWIPFGLIGDARRAYALIRKIPGLKLSYEGVYDFKSNLTFRWEDIREAKLVSLESQEYLAFKLYHLDSYDPWMLYRLIHWFRSESIRPSDRDFLINVSLLKEENESILKQINLYRFAINSHKSKKKQILDDRED